jgi:hypothetical protein
MLIGWSKQDCVKFQLSTPQHSGKEVSIPYIFERLSILFMASRLFIISTGSMK